MSLSNKIEEIIQEERKARWNSKKALGLSIVSATLALYFFEQQTPIEAIEGLVSSYIAVGSAGYYNNFKYYANWLREKHPVYFSNNSKSD